MTRVPIRLLASAGVCMGSVLAAQGIGVQPVGQVAPAPDEGTPTESEEGIPVHDQLTLAKCGACHAPDAKGNMSRISWSRTTPEGWNEAIKRMVRLNGLRISPAEMRSVVKYLSATHGLAPEEAKTIAYMPEHRLIDETIIPNEQVRGGCASCHGFGHAMQWRRSKTEWKLLQNLHVAMYSQADAQYRRQVSPTSGEPMPARTPDGQPEPPTNGEVALDWLGKNAQLHTAEWAAWASRVRAPGLAGRWLVAANVPGQGRFTGEMTISPGSTKDEFTTAVTLRSLDGTKTISRTGTGVVYAGFQWRGRSQGGAAAGAPDDLTSTARETLAFSPAQTSAEGRWYWGEYGEFGADVRLVRAGAGPTLAMAVPARLKAGTKGAQVTLIGDALPASPALGELDFGAGVKATRVVSATPTALTVMVDVDAQAPSGERDVQVGSAVLEKAIPVYRGIDYLKVTPETALAHLGSATHPAGYQQFDAIGYENGPDGKPHTADDVALGSIDASWQIDEFVSVYGDDDKSFVGKLSPTALFTPASDGPDATRRFGRNNYGEVWVTATAKGELDKFGKPLSGRAFMIVAVPTYLKWDQPEVSQ